MSVQTMYRIIVRNSMMTVLLSVILLLFSMSALATVKSSIVAAYILAHPPVTGDCVSCHPDVKTMPRIK